MRLKTNSETLVKMKSIIESYGDSLITNIELCNKVRAETASTLGLYYIP